MIDYNILPEHLRGGMKRYIENGIKPGSFLTAVICNDLVRTLGLADQTSVSCLMDIGNFFYNEAPGPCHGSKEKMDKWMEETRQP